LQPEVPGWLHGNLAPSRCPRGRADRDERHGKADHHGGPEGSSTPEALVSPTDQPDAPRYDPDGSATRAEITRLEQADDAPDVRPEWAFGAWRKRMRLEHRLAAQQLGVHLVAYVNLDGAPVCNCGLIGPIPTPTGASRSESLYGAPGHRVLPAMTDLAPTFLTEGPWDAVAAWCTNCGQVSEYLGRRDAETIRRSHGCPNSTS
jgi:hypothetical protein